MYWLIAMLWILSQENESQPYRNCLMVGFEEYTDCGILNLLFQAAGIKAVLEVAALTNVNS